MENSHVVPEGWGILPRIPLGIASLSTYSLFMLLAFIVGIACYRIHAKKNGVNREQVFPIILATIFGGALGAKMPIWIMIALKVPPSEWSLTQLLTGRTLLGGLIGAMIAVAWIKRRLQIDTRFGNILAPGVALGLSVGRIGCFLSGCCYGTPTSLPWGIDFGDGIPRHPTQLYEILFFLIAFVILEWCMPTARPGRLMTGFVAAYFCFRFFEEYLRAGEIHYGLTPFQWICLAGLGLILLKNRDSNHLLHPTSMHSKLEHDTIGKIKPITEQHQANPDE